jgi:hypothetical protein
LTREGEEEERMITTSRSTSIGLEKTRQRIACWRETRRYRGAAMPATLWAAAIAAARQHGLYTTARTLHVDYGALKKRLDATRAPRVPAPAFIELPAVRPAGLGPCVIDLEGARGRRLRIEVTGVTVADLVTLTQMAWGHEG